MAIAYKLTDQNMQTFAGAQWTLGEFKETSGAGGLCTSGWLHYYSDPILAAFLNPIHARIEKPRLFEIEVQGKIKGNNGLKFGCTKMRLIKELKFVEPTKKNNSSNLLSFVHLRFAKMQPLLNGQTDG
jgi:hypothetical protein